MLKKIFTYIIILSPMLVIYGTPIATLSIADIALIAILPFMLLDLKKKDQIKDLIIPQFAIIVIYILLQIVYICLVKDSDYIETVFMPTMRILFYYFIIVCFYKKYFNTESGLKFYRITALFASLFLILQFIVLKLTGKYIPGYIQGLDVIEKLQKHAATINSAGRVRSVFAEPSHYAIYCGLYLGIELICISKKIDFSIIIVTVAMLLSTSSTAIILVAIIYFIYFIKNFRYLLSKYSINFIIIVLSIVILSLWYIRTDSYKMFVNRTFIEGNATEGRFGNYDLIFKDETTTSSERIFGNGVLKIEEYIPAFPRIYLYFGYIGMIYFIIISIKNLLNLKGINWIATFLTIVLIFPTEFIFGINILLYAPFIYLDFNNLERNRNTENKGES